MASLRLASFKTGSGASYGAVTDQGIVDLGKKLTKYPTLLDVFPTLTELCGVKYPRGAELPFGRSLAAHLLPAAGGRSDLVDARPLLGEVTSRRPPERSAMTMARRRSPPVASIAS